MIATLRQIIYKAREILKTEGLVSLLGRGIRFLVKPLFEYRVVYLYENTLEDFRNLKEIDFKPKVDNFTLKIVSTNQEADRLEAEGFEFRLRAENSQQLLDKGAIAFCIFVGRELANIGWIRMTEEARDTSNKMKVDYQNNEVQGGFAWTNPKYRRLGFQRYGAFERRRFAFSRGITTYRTYIDKSNIASQVATSKVFRKYGEGRHLKIAWWRFWKEKTLS